MKKYLLIILLILIIGCTTETITQQKIKEPVQRDLILNYSTSGPPCSPCMTVEIFANGDVDIFNHWEYDKTFTKKISKEEMNFIKDEMMKSDFFNIMYTPKIYRPGMAGATRIYFTDGINERTANELYIPKTVKSKIDELLGY